MSLRRLVRNARMQHAAPTSRPHGKTAVIALLAVGALLWWSLGHMDRELLAIQLGFVAAAGIVAAILSRRRATSRLLDRIRHPSRSAARITAACIAIGATLYLIGTGIYQGRDFIPKFHDEHMYLLQMQMLARGRLWYPQHELADFFEASHILVKPVYASIYFPGLALMYMPSVWLGLPVWLMPVIVCGLGAAMLYRVVTELLDGVAGALAVALLLGLKTFRYISLIVMSHTALMLLGLIVIFAWMRWREKKDWRWMLLMGATGGWMAITRPVDTFAWAIPIGVMVLWDLRGAPWREKLTTLALGLAAAAPFLALQFTLNLGVTGELFKTPDHLYLEQNSPQRLWGFGEIDPDLRPQTTLQQKLDYYEQFTLPAVRAHRSKNIFLVWWRERFPLLLYTDLPSTLLTALLPVGLLALSTSPRRVFIAPLVGFLALYFLFVYLLDHYLLVIAPAVIFLAVAGRHVIERAFARSRFVSLFSTFAVLALALANLPELNPRVRDDVFEMPTMVYSHIALPRLVQTPAIVLFRYSDGTNIHEEPVYNIDVAWPDDAEIIRAQDLGPQRNRELIDYYARRQPGRRLYLFDRRTAELHDLGTVGDLARAASTTTRTPAPATMSAP